MKLLQQQQLNDAKSQNSAQELRRTESIQKAAEIARKDLANANADFNSTMASFKEKWALEEEAHQKRKDAMELEIKELEEKKRLAMVPIDLYQKQATQLMEALKQKEHDIDQLRELLEDKLDDVGSREQKCRDRELKIISREQGIDQQIIFMKKTAS